MISVLKQVVRKRLARTGRHLVYTPVGETTGLSLELDLPIVVTGASPLIFDVGANVGQSIELFQSVFPSPKIFAFEPASDCFMQLQARYPGGQPRLFQVALSSREEKRPFYQYERSVLNSLLPLDAHPENRFADVKLLQTSSLRTRTLDSICAELGVNHIDLLKVDTQGFDLEVLHGAQDSFRDRRIGAVMIELNFVSMYAGQADAEAVCIFLRRGGFQLVDYYEKFRQNHCLAWCTALFRLNQRVNGLAPSPDSP